MRNTGDFKTIGQLYTEDAKVYPQFSEVVEGPEAIAKLWESYQPDMTEVSFETIEIIEAGHEYAIQVGKSESKWKGERDFGKFMTVWKKEGDSWKILRETWHSDAPTETPTQQSQQ